MSDPINLAEILSFLTPQETAVALPDADVLSVESLASHGYDCFKQYCSLTGAPVASVLPSLALALIDNAYRMNHGDIEAIVDDLALRALTQCRPSPELVRLSPKSFIALPMRTQIAYLVGRWLNPRGKLTPLGIDILEVRRAQLRFWVLLQKTEIPKDVLSALHFRLLEVDSALNLMEVEPPALYSLRKLIEVKTPEALGLYLATLGSVWADAITDHSRLVGNQVVQAAFLRSFLDQPTTTAKRSSNTIVEIANKKLAEKRQKESRFEDRKAAIMADESLTPVQRARKLDLAKRPLGDLNDLISLSHTVEKAKPLVMPLRAAPKLNLFRKKDSI